VCIGVESAYAGYWKILVEDSFRVTRDKVADKAKVKWGYWPILQEKSTSAAGKPLLRSKIAMDKSLLVLLVQACLELRRSKNFVFALLKYGA
jgi:hypothetical protein